MSVFRSLLMQSIPEYTKIEYIESSGTQYIDTGISLKANSNFNVSYSISSIINWETIIGVDNDNSERLFFGAVASSNIGRSYWYYANQTTTFSNGIGQLNLKTNITSQNGTITMSNTNGTMSKTLTGTITPSLLNIYLFALNRKGSGTDYAKAKIYSAKIYDGAILERDFIPVLDKNNVACLYDNVTKQFYYNQGTGDFTPGNPIN